MEKPENATLAGLYRSVRFRVKHSLAQSIERRPYQHWIRRVEQGSYNEGRIRQEIAKFAYKPKISVIVPVYNTPVKILDLAIGSVRRQIYENWELCICDDASPDTRVRVSLEKWQKRDARIKVNFCEGNEGISGASNRALQMASGEFVGLLDHDDELSADALYEMVKLLQEHREADMIYSDEDRLDAKGRRVQPFFKPDWSPEYMLSCMYTCHFGVYRKRLVEEIGGFRGGFDGSQDYDLVLRLSEKTTRIFHVPKILYHWRMVASSAAADVKKKPEALAAAKRALAEHLERRGISGEVEDGASPSHYRIKFRVRGTEKVSIVMVASGKGGALRNCVESIEKKTRYGNYEIMVVIARSAEDVDTKMNEELASRGHRVLNVDEPFDWARLVNLGCRQADGEYLLLLHQDAEVISEDWIGELVGICQQTEIGVVGAKLLGRNDLLQHVGIVLGLKGIAGRPLRGFPRNTREGFGIAGDLRNCAAVSAACMMMRKNVFSELGGFDEMLSNEHGEIDFCLRVRRAGYRVACTPWAELYCCASAPVEHARRSSGAALLEKRWEKCLAEDPYYNSNLTLRNEDCGFRA